MAYKRLQKREVILSDGRITKKGYRYLPNTEEKMKETTKIKIIKFLVFFEKFLIVVLAMSLLFLSMIIIGVILLKDNQSETVQTTEEIPQETTICSVYDETAKLECRVISIENLTSKHENLPTVEQNINDEMILSFYETVAQDMETEIESISYIEDKKEWFIAYKAILEKYSDILDIPSIYDEYSKEEIELMWRCVETENYDQKFESKCNVISVVLNRYNSGKFGKTIGEIITKPRQFAYYRTKITESTKLAVEYVLMFGDTTDGCMAFRSDKKPKTWWDWEYQFTDGSGHNFYK